VQTIFQRKTWWIEVFAILANLGFTVFYIRQSSWAFLLGVIGPILLGILSWSRKLYADIALQVFYVLITIWGWLNLNTTWKEANVDFTRHLISIVLFLTIAMISGYWLKKKTEAALPYLDSTVTSFSILATIFMMAGCHENWIYFMVIDLICIFLFANRKLYGISALYFLYFLLAIEGYFHLGWIGS
jgi:nicotinamide mononucleotide transporter